MGSETLRVTRKIEAIFTSARIKDIARLRPRAVLAATGLLATLLISPYASAGRATQVPGSGRKPIRLILVCDSPSRPVRDAELTSVKQIIQARLGRLGLQSIGVEID